MSRDIQKGSGDKSPKKKEKGVSALATRYAENPFIKSEAEYARNKKRTVVAGGKAVVDMGTGEIESTTAEVVTTHEVDPEQFIKLYTAELKSLFSLTASAMKLFQVLLKQVQNRKDSDTILLNINIMQKYFEELEVKPISKPTFYRCMNEMINKGFIAPAATSKDLFYINPNLFFNGDRLKIVKEFHIKRQVDMFEKAQEEKALEGNGNE